MDFSFAATQPASTETPRKHEPRITPITTMVLAAFLLSGFLNAGTPLLTASTPDTKKRSLASVESRYLRETSFSRAMIAGGVAAGANRPSVDSDA